MDNKIVIKWLSLDKGLGNQNFVKLEINGVDLLTSVNATGEIVVGLPLLIPTFAIEGLMCLKYLSTNSHAILTLDDYGDELIFIKLESEVLVYDCSEKRIAMANYSDLLSSWYAFANKIYLLLQDTKPDLYNSKVWACLDAAPLPSYEKYYVRNPYFISTEEFLSLKKASN